MCQKLSLEEPEKKFLISRLEWEMMEQLQMVPSALKER